MKHIPEIINEVAILMVLTWGGQALGAVPDVPETWTNADAAGWVKHDLVNEQTQNTLTVENSSLKLLFASQSMLLPPEEYVFEASSAASGGNFTGDYVTQGVTEIHFRLFCERPAEVSLILSSENSSRIWRYRIPDIQTGKWMSVTVPVSIPAVACLNDAATWSSFETDLHRVKSVGVAIERAPGLAAQSYWLDDFALAGTGPGFAAWMDQFPKPSREGTGDCSVLSGADLDGDGVANGAEWIAGTSAGDAADQFRVFIASGTPPSRHLRWKSAPGRVYQVWSTTDLNQPFAPASPPIAATAPENCFDDALENDNLSMFYKITVDYPGP